MTATPGFDQTPAHLIVELLPARTHTGIQPGQQRTKTVHGTKRTARPLRGIGGNMAQITVADAARRANVQRSTIYRRARKGSLSLERAPGGGKRIEESEFYRVFPNASREPQPPQDASKQKTHQTQRAHQGGSGAEINQLRRELEMLKQRLHDLDADKTDLRSERDRLISIVESTTRQLEDLRAPASFWERVFGRRGSKTAAAVFIAVLLIGSGTAWGYKIFGSGGQSCGTWTAEKERAKGDLPMLNFKSWVGGYLTAYNLWVEDGSGPVNETQIEGAWAWVDNYCRDNSNDDVATATLELIYAINAR